MNVNERLSYAKRLINNIHYMTLATVGADGQPWSTPVFYAYDGKVTFYWGSLINTQHSQNIVCNKHGFIVIYDSTVEPGHGEAVYAQVLCEELNDTVEIGHAMELLHKRFGKAYMNINDVQGLAERRLYKAMMKTVWVKDRTQDIREEIPLLTNNSESK